MPDPVYADTLKSGISSKRGNKYGQDYFNRYGWSRYHPMVQKSEACDTMSLMFKRYGVLPKMIVYKSKGKSLGAFTCKCRESGCHLVNGKTYSPWSHMAEGFIGELKSGSARQLIKMG